MLFNNIGKVERRRAVKILFLSIFIVLISVYFISIWNFLIKINVITYNEDIDRNTAQLIESRGFKAEDHYIKTEDGYILTVTRIINPYVKNQQKLRPILLQHGFQNNANVWITNSMGVLTIEGKYVEDNNEGPVGNTLGFVLAVNDFDVWLANMRGNMYSLNHTSLKIEDPEFWRFSIDEMIKFDLPAIISYIQRETSKTELAYIGHSQGTYMMFSLLATRQEYSNIIKPFIALSPVPFMGNTSSPLAKYGNYIYSLLRSSQTSLALFGKFQKFYSQLCDSNKLFQYICYHIFYATVGFERNQFNMSRTGVYHANLPSGSSCWNAAHLLQIVKWNKPMKYDFGDTQQNLEFYNSSEPPEYNMSAINSTNIALIYTANDWLNQIKDINLLKQHLKVKLLDDYLVEDMSWNHMELIWAIEAGKYVNSRILNILNNFN